MGEAEAPRWLAGPGVAGRRTLALVAGVGRSALFLGATLRRMFARPFRGRLVLQHMRFIGNRSVGIVLLTSTFTGMVLVLQGHNALSRFGSEIYLGPLVALSLIRELGPVLAALMVTARAGSAIAATIAGMRVTEQIDALEVMAVDSVQYLASTRMLAALLVVPMLTAFFNLAGIAAAHTFGVSVLGIDGGTFMASIRDSVELSDVNVGVVKSLLFAIFIAWVSTDQGYHATRGAEGIGRATTTSVVVVSVLVLAGDYVMTALLL
ncbi:MAG: ABC transporter permease [Myxococcales bacterium]|nr:ABC transporter permease [Myxococcales bacterium]